MYKIPKQIRKVRVNVQNNFNNTILDPNEDPNEDLNEDLNEDSNEDLNTQQIYSIKPNKIKTNGQVLNTGLTKTNGYENVMTNRNILQPTIEEEKQEDIELDFYKIKDKTLTKQFFDNSIATTFSKLYKNQIKSEKDSFVKMPIKVGSDNTICPQNLFIYMAIINEVQPENTDEQTFQVNVSESINEEQPAGTSDQRVRSLEQPAGISDQRVRSLEQPAGTSDQRVRSLEQPAGTSDQRVRSLEQPAGTSDQRVGSWEQPPGWQRPAAPWDLQYGWQPPYLPYNRNYYYPYLGNQNSYFGPTLIEDQTRAFADQKQALEEKTKAFADQQEALKEKTKVFADEKQALEEKTKVFANEKQAFEDQQKALKEKTKAFGDKKQALKEKTKALKDEKEALEEKTKTLNEQKQNLENQTKALKDEKEALEEKTKALNDQKQALENQTKALNDQKQTLEKQIGKTKVEQNNSQEKINIQILAILKSNSKESLVNQILTSEKRERPLRIPIGQLARNNFFRKNSRPITYITSGLASFSLSQLFKPNHLNKWIGKMIQAPKNPSPTIIKVLASALGTILTGAFLQRPQNIRGLHLLLDVANLLDPFVRLARNNQQFNNFPETFQPSNLSTFRLMEINEFNRLIEFIRIFNETIESTGNLNSSSDFWSIWERLNIQYRNLDYSSSSVNQLRSDDIEKFILTFNELKILKNRDF